MLTAGHTPTDEIWQDNERLFRRYLRFLQKSDVLFINCAEIGEPNAKMDFLKKQMDMKVKQLVIKNLNYLFIENKYDVIFCFETLEHVANQLTMMESIKGLMHKDSVLFISFPSRPRWLWTTYHYHEISKDRFERWLLNPLGLKIIRYKRLFIDHPWWFFLTGIRPFFRLFYNYTNIYEIRHA